MPTITPTTGGQPLAIPKLCPVETETIAGDAPIATVSLIACGDRRTVATVCALTGLPFNEAKALVEDAPSIVAEDVSLSDAEEIKAVLEMVGATAVVWLNRSTAQYAGGGHGA
jgi:hypothetical protein